MYHMQLALILHSRVNDSYARFISHLILMLIILMAITKIKQIIQSDTIFLYYLKVSNKSCMYQIKYLSLRC